MGNHLQDAIDQLGLNSQEQFLYNQHLHNLGMGGVHNADGSTSTLLQMGVGRNGRSYNIPTVWDNKVLPNDEALHRADQAGIDNFPSYDSNEAAESRYSKMHDFMEQDLPGEKSMNLGPDADPMEAFRELFGQFAGQGGGSAPATGGRIASQPLPDLTPRPSPVAPAPKEYNPLDDVDSEPPTNDMSDAAVNKHAWLAQGKNLPEPTQAPMGKRRAAPTGIQQSPGTSQPTQGQAPVPGSGAPKTPPPGATAASVMTTPPSKPGMNLTGDVPMPDGGGGQIPPQVQASRIGGSGYNAPPAIPTDPGQPGLRGGAAPNTHGFQNGVRDIIARLMQGGQNVAEFLQPGFTAGKPMMPPGGSQSTQPPIPQEMLIQAIADRQRNGPTQGNTPRRGHAPDANHDADGTPSDEYLAMKRAQAGR